MAAVVFLKFLVLKVVSVALLVVMYLRFSDSWRRKNIVGVFNLSPQTMLHRSDEKGDTCTFPELR
jgi:hypothetical protein